MKAITKNSWQDMKHSKARFFSIIGIIFLGVSFFSGIKAASPDMIKAADQYFATYRLHHATIETPLGFSDEQFKVLQHKPYIQTVQKEKKIDITLQKSNEILRVMSYDKNRTLDRVSLLKGRLPQKQGEIMLDSQLQVKKNLKLKDRITFDKTDAMKTSSYKIVGFINSPLYIERFSRGNTTLGKGSVDGFAYVLSTNFSIPFNTFSMRFKDMPDRSYSTAYIKKERKYLKQLKKDVQQEWTKSQPVEPLEKSPQHHLSPMLYFFTRKDQPGYKEYNENAKRIANIARVFPVFFFLIAALVCFTTMARMIEEKRKEIGVLKALGYYNREIATPFLFYAGSSGIIGTFLGIVIGNLLFPRIIFHAYKSMYSVTEFQIHWYLKDIVWAFLIAFLCTVGSSFIALYRDVLQHPALLMRPKAPKIGKRLFLERFTFIWKKLKFTSKVTLRNVFRYKIRATMTILGIAGCMALMITGFGLRNSIGDIPNLQFHELWHYESIVHFKDDQWQKDISYKKEKEALKIKQELPVLIKNYTKLGQKGVNHQEFTMYVPKRTSQLSSFLSFRNRKTKNQVSLTDHGVIISEKLARLFHLKKGETFSFTDANKKEYRINISNISENYTNHYVYMTPVYYEKIFKEKPHYNSEFLTFHKTLTKEKENKLAHALMQHPSVLNVTFLSRLLHSLNETMKTLGIVVGILILSAALLAFIVLYNLSNINVSERIRELSTIKVLGFYDNEVTAYLYRETLLLMLIGIFIGCGLGKVMHLYVLQTVEVDAMMFSPTIHFESYLYAAFLTMFFTFSVMGMMHYKVKKVDMLEALKENE